MSELCLTLLCPPEIEEKLLDLLLMSPVAKLYTSASIAAHGEIFDDLDQMEQVLGRANVTQVQVILAETDKTSLLENISQHFAGAGLRYWLTPVIEFGEVA